MKAKPAYGLSPVGSWIQNLYCEFVDVLCKAACRSHAVAVSDAQNEWRKVLSDRPIKTRTHERRPFCWARDTTGLTWIQTIRITRTLIRDNTHDLNDTRGHSFYWRQERWSMFSFLDQTFRGDSLIVSESQKECPNQGSSNPNCLNFLKDAYKVYQGVPPTYLPELLQKIQTLPVCITTYRQYVQFLASIFPWLPVCM